jgi:hypothetical protein
LKKINTFIGQKSHHSPITEFRLQNQFGRVIYPFYLSHPGLDKIPFSKFAC